MRKGIRNALLVGTLMVGSSGVTLAAAQATGITNVSTSTNTLTSSRCYHHHGHSVTNFHWSSKLGRYVAYTSPHVSTTDYNKCK